jgi:N-acetylneuraminic acid mutarotase
MFISAAAQQKEAAPKKWHIAATLPSGKNGAMHLGIAGPVAGVHNNVLLVGGGANFPGAMPWLGGAKKYQDALYVYEKTGSGNLQLITTEQLPFPLAYSANCTTPKGVVVAGGEKGPALSKDVLLLQWNAAEKKVSFGHLPQLPLALTNAAIATDGRNVYLAGGETAATALDLFLCLDLEDTVAGWQSLPNLPQPVSHAVLAVVPHQNSQRVFLLGGRKKNPSGISSLYASAFAFDVDKRVWQQKNALPYALSAGTGIATSNHSIWLLGGDKGETFHRTETLIAAIAQEGDAVKKEALNQQKIAVQSGHPGFSNKVLHYDEAKDTWSEKGTIHFAVPVTTTAVRWNDQILIVSGEIKAGVRTPNILAAQLE